jgi:V/A-type H+-transporting ATPase subunit A
MPGLDRKKAWLFKPSVKEADTVGPGDVIGTVQETPLVLHKIMVPPGVKGKVTRIKEGAFTVEQAVAQVSSDKNETHEITMRQTWPVRFSRPVKEKLLPDSPLTTGQRVIDMLFPIAKGGTACIPGPFGSGKTVVQHQLAKWAEADIIVYIGCGERGNEIADVLLSFPELKDPKTQRPLLERTIVIANTSNMPVAAREASVYTGITIAEYFRDMGYSVALMADSTSRWAEAMREISGRLEEMPGEEGYPAYLNYRIAEFYERAGRAVCLGGGERIGSVSVIGAVSPPGGDLSDPVVQATLRVVKVFWALDENLAYARHFPAINWLLSYSLYVDNLGAFYSEKIDADWLENRNRAMAILQEEAQLKEIARLVGVESLSPKERLTLEVAKSIREDFLHQHAFDEKDSYTSLHKQFKILRVILAFYREAALALEEGFELSRLLTLAVRRDIARAKYAEESGLSYIEKIERDIATQVSSLARAS